MTGPQVPAEQALHQLGAAARRWAETADLDAALHDVVYTCCRLVPCQSAAIGVTSAVPGRQPVSVRAASDPAEFAVLLDIVSRVPASPGVLAAAGRTVLTCADLAAENRPELAEFAALALQETSVRSTIALALQIGGSLVGVLNLYFDRTLLPDDPVDVRARAVADHVAILLGAQRLEQRADNLELALATSRTIGAAVGILVERHRITDNTAFEVLRSASQELNRKVSELAEQLVLTGTLPGGG